MVDLETMRNLGTTHCFAGVGVAAMNSLQYNPTTCVLKSQSDLAVPYNPALCSLVSKAICMTAFTDPQPEHAHEQCAKT